MKKIISYLSILGIVLFVTLISFNPVYASGVDYTVQPQSSDKQVDPALTYFDLRLEPKANDKLNVVVKNSSDHEITVYTSVDVTSTNSNGVVEYKNSKNFQHIQLKNNLSKIIQPDVKEIKLNAKESKIVSYTVKMPENEFDGVLAGGINFIQKNSDDKDEENKNGMAVKNEYGYTIAVVLHGKNKITKNNVTLSKITPNQINGRNGIKIPIQNESAAFLNKVQVKAVIYTKGTGEKKYETNVSGAQIAPNSVYDFDLSLNEKKLEPGKYTAKVTVLSKKQKWAFTQDFTIKKEVSQKLNEKAVVKADDSYTLYIIIGIILFVLLLVLCIYLFIRKNREIKRLNNQLENKRKEKLSDEDNIF
ncbi:DUF916 and DUF3324 domain-containing protein [Enterococcus thailandicus]|uniref:DUF916 and DUF3324 domain-containing protein n=1 Tax=Enterococcus thailandicus TaxID=417368 RepID=UPI0035D58293